MSTVRIYENHVPHDEGWGFKEGRGRVKKSQELKVEILQVRGLSSADQEMSPDTGGHKAFIYNGHKEVNLNIYTQLIDSIRLSAASLKLIVIKHSCAFHTCV